MNTIVENKQFKLEKLTITEQLIFLVDSETELNDSRAQEEKKISGIMGALLADLFLMKKVGLVNNKVVVTATHESGIDYIDGFISKLRSVRDNMYMRDIIYEEKPLAKGIEQNIRDKLLAEEWLTEKRGLIPFISQKDLQPENKDLVKETKKKLAGILNNNAEPEKEEIFLLAILQAINLLKPVLGSLKNEKKAIERLNELITEEYLAKMIHNAIKSQIKPQSQLLIHMQPPGYMAGIGGLVPR